MIPSEILRKVRQSEIRTRSVVNSVLSGAYSSTFKGRGMEFAEVREYLPGDEIRSIDWNVTARLQIPHVRQYNEDREVTAWFLLDLSPSVDFGSQERKKRHILIIKMKLSKYMARIRSRKLQIN